MHAVPFKDRSSISGLTDVDEFSFLVPMYLNAEEVFEISEVLHLVFLPQCCLQFVDTDHILSENDEIVHPYCKNNFCILVDIYTGI